MNNIIKRKWNQNSMVIIEDLHGMAFQAESGGHTFQISGIDGEGNTVALSGTPAGVMLRSDGQDVTLTCSVSGGVVSATLPANAYSVPGRFGLTIFLTSDGQKTAIYAAVGTVGKTSSGTVAPPAGSDVVDLVNAIATAVATIPASYTDLMASVAPTYSSSGLYAVGSYAWYNGKLYRCTTPITSGETWTSGHWTLANLGSDLVDLKSAVVQDTGIIGNIIHGEEVDLLKEVMWEVGAFNSQGQPNTGYSTRLRTIYFIDVRYISSFEISIDTGYKYKLYWYNDSYEFISTGNWTTTGAKVSIPSGVVYLKLLVADTSDGSASISYSEKVSIVADNIICKLLEDDNVDYVADIATKSESELVPTWQQGYLNNTTGQEADGNTGIRSNWLYVRDATRIDVELVSRSLIGEAKIFYYEEQGQNRISVDYINETSGSFAVPSGTNFIRLNFNNWSGTISPSDASSIFDSAVIVHVDDEYELIKSRVSSLIDYNADNVFPIDLSLVKWVRGGLNGSGVEYETNNVIRSDFIESLKAKKVFVTFNATDTISSWKIFFFNSSKTYISRVEKTTNGDFSIDVPYNTVYIRLSIENWNATFPDTSKKSYFNSVRYWYYESIESVKEKLSSDIVGDVYATSIESIVKNTVLKRYPKIEANYPAGQTYYMTEVSSLSLESGKTYTLYCGYINGDYSPLLRIYIKYSDNSVEYFNVDASTKFNTFTLKNKTISVQALRAISVNSGTSASAGTAYYYNALLFEGGLTFRDEYGFDLHIPDYYVNHLITKEATIRGHQKDCSFDGDCFVFLTDTHYSPDYLENDNYYATQTNTNYSIPMTKHIIENTAMRFIVHNGDLINETNGIDAMIHGQDKLFAHFGNYADRVMCVVGNHEYYTDLTDQTAGRPTVGELYGSLIKYNENKIVAKGPMDTYAFDNTIQKIRYFMVSCGRDVELTTEQLEWIMDELTKIPSGYRIVVIGHAFISPNMDSFRGDHEYIAEALDAVNARTSYTYNGNTYNYSDVDADVICIITGHTHIDGNISTEGGIPCICTTCDSWFANYEMVEGTPTRVARDKTTVDSQAFDVIQFDFTNKKIYCTRIGYGSDREFTYGS